MHLQNNFLPNNSLPFISLTLIVLTFMFNLDYVSAKEKEVTIGRVEYVTVKQSKQQITYKARIDTGAGISSIHAEDIRIVKDKNSKKTLVKFNLINSKSKKTGFKVPLSQWMRIKNKHNEGFSKRPVVRLKLCIGDTSIKGRVNLADRSNFLYPVLIGRNILKEGDFLVDSRKKFTTESTCS